MKFIFLLNLGLIILYDAAFCQCPQPGLKFQSATCNNPTNLKTTAILCSQLKVQWKDSRDEKYVVRATGINAVTQKSFETEVSKYSCDNNGNCQATIPVKEGTDVSWSVQGVCTQGNGTLYGYKVDGQQVTIPVCENTRSGSNTLKAYPNPTAGNLIVEYDGSVTSDTKFIISDVSGKSVFSIPGTSVSRANNAYKLDLHHLNSGTYVLKLINGNDVRQVKFVLIRD